ncbi:unnamed protein product [Bursaphelenchus xylophilus]|uniref:(pine wood nematode) hypothetical protein n=1 Tax=Bursaphelenchus xylophilus TaxID=6326 RepID=A0A1I7RR34_BURXY|nr:unnamed protein product [Bursaphelenchus xylophilus]CAG9130825.1 unnamed protein product [Bursaphelenchus xylophilus]
MRTYEFSLQAPSEEADGKAEVPEWLNAEICQVNAKHSSNELGRINLKLAAGELNVECLQQPLTSRPEFNAQVQRSTPMKQDQPENFQDNFDVDCFFPSRNDHADPEIAAINKGFAQSIGQRIYLLLRNTVSNEERKVIKSAMNSALHELESSLY